MPVLTNTPQNKAVLVNNPNNQSVLTNSPQNKSVILQNFTYLDDRAFQKGQTMGLLLALTYPIAGTWTNAPRL